MICHLRLEVMLEGENKKMWILSMNSQQIN